MVASIRHSPPASADLLFRAFADPTRLRILHLLTPGELCVCDLVDVLRVPQPKVSRHLAYLRRAGLVLARREGLWTHYQLAPSRNSLHGKLLDCLACCLGQLPELAADARKLRARRPDRIIASCC
jgi:ArsR family transcriptional regulator